MVPVLSSPVFLNPSPVALMLPCTVLVIPEFHSLGFMSLLGSHLVIPALPGPVVHSPVVPVLLSPVFLEFPGTVVGSSPIFGALPPSCMSGPCTLTPLVISSTVSASAPSGASVSSPKLPVRPSLSSLSLPRRLSRSYLYFLPVL